MRKVGHYLLYAGVALAAVVAGLLLSHRGDNGPTGVAPLAVAQTRNATSGSGAAVLLAAALPDISGAVQRVDQWKGKVLVVNFWATWCAPCREEIPMLIDVQNRLGPSGVQIVGIAIDQPDKVKSYAQEMRINYPILIGELDAIELARQAGNRIGALPFTVILDRSGNIAKTELGGLTQDKIERAVRALL